MTLNIFLSGDIFSESKASGFIGASLAEKIKTSDLAICNFEAPVINEAAPPIKKAGPHMRQPPEVLDYLFSSGFGVFNLSNNHIMDYGQIGLDSTISRIKSFGGNWIGAGRSYREAYEPLVIDIRGVKVGLVSGCENQFGCLDRDISGGGYSWINHFLIEDNIRKLKNEVDIVLVLAHAGLEDIDFPLLEWRDRYRRLCDVGADIIIGSHPHVPQGIERYNSSVIFYSLGNFFFESVSQPKPHSESFSVVLKFKGKNSFEFDILTHRMNSLVVDLVDADLVGFDLEELNNLLTNNFLERNSRVAIEFFEQYYLRYYESALGAPKRGCGRKAFWRSLVRILVRKRRLTESDLLLWLHNIKIESHRYVTVRALSEKLQENRPALVGINRAINM